jgi:acetyl esterase/lipase
MPQVSLQFASQLYFLISLTEGILMRYSFCSTLLACLTAFSAAAELLPVKQPVETDGSRRTYVFKSTPQGDLKVHVFLPEGWQAGQKHPAIVMFFGGGFTGGSPDQFRTKAIYLASRGMVALTPEYRVKTRHQTAPDKSIEDAKSAIRWTRMNAAALGIDPERIVGSGGSAGGTCAALTALSDRFEPEGEDRAVSSRPSALVLYNPALAPPDTQSDKPGISVVTAWKVTKGDVPMIFFFGTNDQLLAGSRSVAAQEVAKGNRAELYTADGQKHGFFNDATTARNGSPGWHDATLYQTDVFLTSLGYLRGGPAVQFKGERKVLKRESLDSGL